MSADVLPVCPHCGLSIARDTAVSMGRLSVSPSEGATFDGKRIALTPQLDLILHTMVTMDREWSSTEILLNRISDSENTNLVAVQMSRLRKILTDLIGQNPIETRRKRVFGSGGYRLRAEAFQ